MAVHSLLRSSVGLPHGLEGETRVMKVASASKGIVATVAGLLVVGLTLRQTMVLDRYFIFFPERGIAATPADVGLEFEDVFFSASDGVTLHGWYVPADSDLTLLWFHGNAGNVANRLEHLALTHRLLGVNVFIFDYRGYGLSEGSVSEAGTYLDAAAAVDYLVDQKSIDPGRQLVMYGHSLGGSVAVEMAGRYPARGLIVESTFTSIRGMAKILYPYLPSGVLTSFLRTRYDSLSKIAGARAPVMVVHGDSDETVPMAEGRRLYEAATHPKRFLTVVGAGHNDVYAVGGERYFEALRRFIEDPEGDESP